MKADNVIFGNIYTVDKSQPKARAAAIAGGKFVYVGDEAGVVVTSASDNPVENPAYPLTGIQKGVTRHVPGQPETLHWPAERVTVEQMIEATTLNEAYQLLCEDRLGSITSGKEADLVVLEEDITACDSERIADTKVLRTMVGGAWV